jgi:hypothetical protein
MCVTKLRNFLREAQKQVPSLVRKRRKTRKMGPRISALEYRALPNFANSFRKRRDKLLHLLGNGETLVKMVRVYQRSSTFYPCFSARYLRIRRNLFLRFREELAKFVEPSCKCYSTYRTYFSKGLYCTEAHTAPEGASLQFFLPYNFASSQLLRPHNLCPAL